MAARASAADFDASASAFANAPDVVADENEDDDEIEAVALAVMSEGSNEYLAPNDDDEVFCFFLAEKDRAWRKRRGLKDGPTNNTTKTIAAETRIRLDLDYIKERE